MLPDARTTFKKEEIIAGSAPESLQILVTQSQFIPFISHEVVYNKIMLEGLLTVKQASERFGLSDAHIRRLLEHDTIKGTKMGFYWLVHIDSMEHYVANRPKRGRKPKDREAQ